MKSNYLISVKSSGLCFNIMRLIILTKLSEQYNRSLIFLTKPSHIPILKKFNHRCMFIPYIEDHTKQFNNFTRRQNLRVLYDFKYLRFLKSQYFDNLFNNPNINEFKIFNGCMYDIKNTDDRFIIVDYNDGTYDTEILNLNSIPPIMIQKKYIKYNKDFLTINIKINNPGNHRIYDFWDAIIPRLQEDYKKPILLISGNNDIKKYIGDKHRCLYKIIKTETNFSNVRGNNIIRGKADEIYNDLITCACTSFIPFIELRKKYPEILSQYEDLNFVTEKVEKFDILAEYLSKYIIIQES